MFFFEKKIFTNAFYLINQTLQEEKNSKINVENINLFFKKVKTYSDNI